MAKQIHLDSTKYKNSQMSCQTNYTNRLHLYNSLRAIFTALQNDLQSHSATYTYVHTAMVNHRHRFKKVPFVTLNSWKHEKLKICFPSGLHRRHTRMVEMTRERLARESVMFIPFRFGTSVMLSPPDALHFPTCSGK